MIKKYIFVGGTRFQNCRIGPAREGIVDDWRGVGVDHDEVGQSQGDHQHV